METDDKIKAQAKQILIHAIQRAFNEGLADIELRIDDDPEFPRGDYIIEISIPEYEVSLDLRASIDKKFFEEFTNGS